MPSLASELISLVRDNDLPTLLRRINSRDTHPAIQFIKYGICGVAALITHAIIYKVLVTFFYQELNDTTMDPMVRGWKTIEPTAILFIFPNLLVYWLNTRWVFTPGKHSKVKEFLLFTIVNMPGAIFGVLGQAALVRYLNWPAMPAMLGFVVPNVLINFLCRKFFIFKH
jgi:putative flippase GtrA